ncbi:hypothetical protein FHW20_002113 [Ochrobactrum intermedium]|uniref:Uncharacterized protein n=2 Tax=Brucella intermedia TaxID=94625 RepID=A0ABR6AP52_9HYPH|nr:hypothetical protein [Brucella intermedia]MBA8851178.1 hypothetical protein [Brucella intermedia]MDH0125407.1 hypothetical protein [Brucella intermedia GD04153]
MFKISFLPHISPVDLAIEKRGDVLIINGDELDFTDLPDGGAYPPEALEIDAVFGGVSRKGDEIRITVALPYDLAGEFVTPEPITVTSDGPIALPEGRYPPPPEELPMPEADPIAEGEDDAAQ